jgi:metallo-beta-lactamase family protein
VVFVGYQAKETLGRQILDGEREVRIYGQTRPVRARIEKILGFSAHADRKALFRWLDAFESPPRKLFLTHGDSEIPQKLAVDIRSMKGWDVAVPEYSSSYDLN